MDERPLTQLSSLLSVLPEQSTYLPTFKGNVISGLSLDSRNVQPGDLFLACKGLQHDGRLYIYEAIKKGAAAVFYENTSENINKLVFKDSFSTEIPLIAIEDLSNKVGFIAHQFYQQPSSKMDIVAVTGTNGKTSVCHFIATIMQKLNKKCGVMGTVGYGFLPYLKTANYTTPDSIMVHQWLSTLYQQGAKAVAMEASSHGLSQGRLQGVQNDIAIFTNLTHEHLDYHGTMEKYAAAKKQLFYMPNLKYAVINADDEVGMSWLKELPVSLPTLGYSLTRAKMPHHVQALYADHIQLSTQGIIAQIYTPWGEGKLDSPCWGRFNLSNFLAAIAALCLLGLPFEQVLAYISSQNEVCGRMEIFGGKEQPTVIVDFAHTPDALENVLRTIKAQQSLGQLITVFGCGGDRDQSKRSVMGRIAQELSDFVIVTNDNPRTESPEAIAIQIAAGMKNKNYKIELDRKKAIHIAIQQAKPGDVVLVAGKGHESYQIINNVKYPFSDQKVVQQLLAERSIAG